MTDKELGLAELLYNDGVDVTIHEKYHMSIEKDVYCFFEGEEVIGIAKEFQFSKESPTICRFTDMISKQTKLVSNPFIIERDIVLFKTIEQRGGNSNRRYQSLITRVSYNDSLNISGVKFHKSKNRNEDGTNYFKTINYYHKILYFGENTLEEEVKKRNISKLQDKI